MALEGLNFNEMEIMNTDLGSKANCITYSFDAGTRITPGAMHCTQEYPFRERGFLIYAAPRAGAGARKFILWAVPIVPSFK